mmetsp:Transcript_638/g.885  ORF Transcript_638/g.885 Transcript_638/m.885 type:complete len:340 (-) Transcript_638:540-1559(-)
MTDAMEVEPTPPTEEETKETQTEEMQQDTEAEEEDVGPLSEWADDASAKPPADQITIFKKILNDTEYLGPKAMSLKERCVYDLTTAYCKTEAFDQIVTLLQKTQFLDQITKSKCAKVVRAVLEVVCTLAPTQLEMQADICQSIIEWCTREKRSFLRQRVEAKLASILVQQKSFKQALELVDRLLGELKKLDDKQLLVETHLQESKIHFGLRNTPKAKAALTASRTCANAIYVSPSLQATIDKMSGTLHCEEGDYNTAHSYFLEAFEQLDQLNDQERAVPCLKYMMLCRILDSLTKALQLSAKGGVGKLHLCVCVYCCASLFSISNTDLKIRRQIGQFRG